MPKAASSRKRYPYEGEPELLDMEIPRRKARIGAVTQALVGMSVNKAQPLYFKTPDGVSLQTWAARFGSFIACARKIVPEASYCRRMVEFEGEEGIAVWRTK